ncbi:HlyD family type I secretion periplasmic adaptor subunit [Yersinia enterocolitica]|uniref:HlyD family type I secretion periplasmic adaptor subunit n=1 Tax=Yersinia enterocolitica TaxID=630 RepID=UPI001C610DA6|nr:HlyD family type I secretion periplasmic adaptor subunit [Yersinia enterocolitica]MBW5840058.1 HlyD family type I secretion periplasmic adaptor subunit [Yersinia enterocolitica]MBW5848672.1 HlyD family type I secretion periplasmic adaptor subunit [Yersinia enterocolitica]MBW5857410.1 HlyD family type I secretion periplasmic adaptor subunit [Yersinia enterocolitica]MBW5861742.1 HlyD family type I secretion periplasmic adaptor subunit [Yersinia enterocolitica]MBW5866085.1 HlyD family type I s
MKIWLMGFYEFLLRYKLVWRETWKIRHKLDTPVREKDENEFLPAHLELIETPVSKRPRLIAYFIMAFLAIAIVLSVLGKVEIIATANGKLTLSGRSKEIKPIENSIVKEIMVKEGELVKKGHVLLKLTALGAEADTLKTQSSLLQAKLEQVRYQILNESIGLNKLPELKLSDDPYFHNLSEDELFRLTSLIKEQFSTWQNKKYQKELNLDKKKAERLTILARINRYENLSRVEKSRLDDFRKLLQKQAIAKHAVLEQENKYLEAANELRVYKSQLEQIESEILSAKEEHQLVTRLFKNEVLDKIRQTTDSIKLLTLELKKNEERQQASVIRAPVSGKVQQLKVHTEGGVVTTAETLMVIVPENDTLEVTALVQNKDIGFINVGQNVTIKVEAFPYTRYGYLMGKVKNINLDAIEDQKLGLVFNVIVSIEENYLSTGNKNIPLSSGMAVTAEIKTGMRSVISYLLSPLEESVTESLHER